MGNGSSRDEREALQMSPCPVLSKSSGLDSSRRRHPQTSRCVSTTSRNGHLKNSSVSCENNNTNDTVINTQLKLEKEITNYPSVSEDPVCSSHMSLGFGCENLNVRDYVNDLDFGNQTVISDVDHDSSLKCELQNPSLHTRGDNPQGFSDKDFDYPHCNNSNSLLLSYPALNHPGGGNQEKIVESENRPDLENIEPIGPKTQHLCQYQNSSCESMSCQNPQQSLGFVSPQSDNVNCANFEELSSGGFSVSNRMQQNNSASLQPRSKDFDPSGFDLERYNDFFSGVVVSKRSLPADENESIPDIEMDEKSNETNLKYEPPSNDQKSTTQANSGNFSLQNGENVGAEIADQSLPDQHRSTLFSGMFGPSMDGYSTAISVGSPSGFRSIQAENWNDTGAFQPQSADPDLSISQSQSIRSEPKDDHFSQQQLEGTTTNVFQFDFQNSRYNRMCSGYSSCSNLDDDDDDDDDSVINSSLLTTNSHDRSDISTNDRSDPSNSNRPFRVLSSDSAFDNSPSEKDSRIDEAQESCIVDDDRTQKKWRPLVGGKRKQEGEDSFEEKNLDATRLYRVEPRSDALCIHDCLEEGPVKFSAFMCVAHDDFESFALSFTCTLEKWGFRIFLPVRDLILTGPYHENLARVIKERCNGKVIVIVSKSYPKSDECLFLTYFAKTLDPAAKLRNIIPIYIDKNVENTPNVLLGLSSIQYNQAYRNNFLKTKVSSALRHCDN